MKFEVEEVSSTRRKLAIEIPAERVASEFERAYREIARRASIRGFRPGKAPRGVIERQFGDQIREEVVTSLVREGFSSAVEDAKLEMVSQPELELGTLDPKTALTFSATVDVMPPIPEVATTGFTITRPRVAIVDQDIDKVLEQLRLRHGELVPVEGRTEVARGDFATIAIAAESEGEAIPALNVDSATVEVAGGQLPPVIDDRLALARVGETFTVDGPPPDGAPAELTDRQVRYAVTVSAIAERRLPQLDDEFAKDHGDCETLDELRSRIREQLEREGNRRADVVAREGLVDELVKQNQIDVPESFVGRRIDALLREFLMELGARGLQLSGPEHEAEAREKLRPRAEREVRRDLLLDAVARQLDVRVTDEELAEQLGRIVASGGKHAEQLREHYAHDHARDAVRTEMTRGRTLEQLVARADVEEVDAREPEAGSE
ncbi:MAG: trigger factor [Deltaproteobacteria bacterium]|nr:trigger factor [Deltaproteobacteria bacterium]